MEPCCDHFPVQRIPASPRRGLRFDGIHSKRLASDLVAMIAVSRTREVGIDVERIDASFVHEQIPERFFAPREVAVLRALPGSHRSKSSRYWTGKEAYLKKARGLGSHLSPPVFDFSVTCPANGRWTDRSSVGLHRGSLRALSNTAPFRAKAHPATIRQCGTQSNVVRTDNRSAYQSCRETRIR